MTTIKSLIHNPALHGIGYLILYSTTAKDFASFIRESSVLTRLKRGELVSFGSLRPEKTLLILNLNDDSLHQLTTTIVNDKINIILLDDQSGFKLAPIVDVKSIKTDPITFIQDLISIHDKTVYTSFQTYVKDIDQNDGSSRVIIMFVNNKVHIMYICGTTESMEAAGGMLRGITELGTSDQCVFVYIFPNNLKPNDVDLLTNMPVGFTYIIKATGQHDQSYSMKDLLQAFIHFINGTASQSDAESQVIQS